MKISRVIVIVLDSVGIGELPDAADYGDEGSNTLQNLATAVGGLNLPALEGLGLGNIMPISGVVPMLSKGCFGKMREASVGKDTTVGHWEIAGIILGEEHIWTGLPIIYTSADSVFQIAAHEEIIHLAELYHICEISRELLVGQHQVARVIARPFIGQPGSFKRTASRRDYSIPPPGKTILNLLCEAGYETIGIGKIGDIFAHSGLTKSIPTHGNAEGIKQTIECLKHDFEGMIFVNLVDFDMLYGHRNDIEGYKRALEEFDQALPEIIQAMRETDLLIITADHGCDPTTLSTDHSREFVPLLVYGAAIRSGVNLGIRQTFASVGQTIADIFEVKGIAPLAVGMSFWEMVQAF
ncbi:phosphopentomutase [Candidatus Desantisbacteria bacterium]|nr:phosphopentomutase [Candidatus Desantisbacteria bacterium]